MHTIVVWILVLTFSGYHDSHSIVVDNIATVENCRALAGAIGRDSSPRVQQSRCLAVRKVVP